MPLGRSTSVPGLAQSSSKLPYDPRVIPNLPGTELKPQLGEMLSEEQAKWLGLVLRSAQSVDWRALMTSLQGASSKGGGAVLAILAADVVWPIVWPKLRAKLEAAKADATQTATSKAQESVSEEDEALATYLQSAMRTAASVPWGEVLTELQAASQADASGEEGQSAVKRC